MKPWAAYIDSCYICGQTFPFRNRLTSHMMAYSDSCSICAEKFPFRSWLPSHMETFHKTQGTIKRNSCLTEMKPQAADIDSVIYVPRNFRLEMGTKLKEHPRQTDLFISRTGTRYLVAGSWIFFWLLGFSSSSSYQIPRQLDRQQMRES